MLTFHFRKVIKPKLAVGSPSSSELTNTNTVLAVVAEFRLAVETLGVFEANAALVFKQGRDVRRELETREVFLGFRLDGRHQVDGALRYVGFDRLSSDWLTGNQQASQYEQNDMQESHRHNSSLREWRKGHQGQVAPSLVRRG
jgi:hypothetical protein